jgi:hypothetical protein
MLVFTPDSTPRVRFIFDFILNGILGLNYRITSSEDEFRSSGDVRLNYSREKFPGTITIYPAGLLAENTIRNLYPPVKREGGGVQLFPVGDGSDIPFDLFSAAFFLVSRYEEYLDPVYDEHGRYSPRASLAVASGFLEEPVVDQWAYYLLDRLKATHPSFHAPARTFTMLSTIDIDTAFDTLGKPAWRVLGAFLKEIFTAHWKEAAVRFLVLAGKRRDPLDSYAFILDQHEKYGVTPVFFFLVGEYGKFDHNIPIREGKYRHLIRELQNRGRIGLHPSYRAALDEQRLKKEIGSLAAVLQQPVFLSRQHFLRLVIPYTCRMLMKNGLLEDYSLGYASLPGFRSGTCTPHFFYDLEKEETTCLTLYPISFMDGTLKDYLGLDTSEAKEKIHTLMSRVKEVNGTFHSLWHNHSLSGKGEWMGWRKVFEDMMKFGNELSGQ